jgi:hypothetical protein
MDPLGRHCMLSITLLLLVPTMGLADRMLVHNDQASVNQSSGDANPAQSPDTSKWKVYRNEKYEFQVKYPDAWAVHSSTGTPAYMIYFSGTFRGSQRPQLDMAIQPNMNPRKLSIEEWFAEQQRMTGLKAEATDRLTIGGQAAVFMENSTRSGKERATFVLLHKTDVLCFSYKLGSEDNPTYVAIVDSFRVLK